jgi:hypothetical protein
MRIDRILVGHAPVRMRRPMRSAIHEATHTHNALARSTRRG